jgi:hypothetical protein
MVRLMFMVHFMVMVMVMVMVRVCDFTLMESDIFKGMVMVPVRRPVPMLE